MIMMMKLGLAHNLARVIMGLIIMGQLDYWAEATELLNSSKLEMFVDELPDMPKVLGYSVGPDGKPRPRSFTIGMFYKKWKFHRDLPATPVFAYGTSVQTANIPGPTIEALQGIDSYVTWENHLPANHILPWDPTIPTAIPSSNKGVPTVVHVHGGIDESTSDGNLQAWFTTGFKETGPYWTQKTYHYSNSQQPGNLWYHDHAKGLTRANLLAGLTGAYVVRQPDVEDPLGLPRGDQFDRFLLLADKAFYANGYIYMNRTGDNPSIHPEWQPEYFGDVIIVNGKAWPWMKVQRRKYRFRIINTSNARYFRLSFSNGLDFIHVGSDSAYLNKPEKTNNVFLAPSEIADVIVDFTPSISDIVVLTNDAAYPYPSGSPVNELNSKVMKFIVERKYGDQLKLPTKLFDYPSPDLSSVSHTRYITLYEYDSDSGNPTHLYLNFVSLDAPVTETPEVGSTELWYVINLTPDNHPFHIHLALFSVLDQTELVNQTEFTDCMLELKNATQCDITKYAVGQSVEVPAEEKGWKNSFKMRPGFVTKVLMRFSYIHTNASYPFDATVGPGYVYHCHILDHEDNVMGRPLKMIA